MALSPTGPSKFGRPKKIKISYRVPVPRNNSWGTDRAETPCSSCGNSTGRRVLLHLVRVKTTAKKHCNTAEYKEATAKITARAAQEGKRAHYVSIKLISTVIVIHTGVNHENVSFLFVSLFCFAFGDPRAPAVLRHIY